MSTNDRLKNKNVLITGATAGIGKATAFEFASRDANLILTGRRGEKLKAIAHEIKEEYSVKVVTAAFDIQSWDACLNFVNNLDQQVDILVNNAGLSRGLDPIYEGKKEDWDEMIDTNVKGLLALSRLIIPQMKDRNEGHVINIGSIAGHEVYPGGVVYTATKHAVKAITEASKRDLHGTKVRVSMVSPGLVETEFSKVRFHGDEEKAENVYKGMQALTAQDIAEIIVFTADRPPHVNIMDTIVLPVDQSSSTMVHRNE
ncbi:SDR family NAD(P)-dependent oxidoreductase [Balneola sp. MJW-20]|uniref:SDR family NAD(P)-dependent oxidoreductase n=1 Tax=Gracilimonas aurantiaca TaxID=3234185 RepID=UPI003464FC69